MLQVSKNHLHGENLLSKKDFCCGKLLNSVFSSTSHETSFWCDETLKTPKSFFMPYSSFFTNSSLGPKFLIWRAPQNRFVMTDTKTWFCLWQSALKPFFHVTSNERVKIIFILTNHNGHRIPAYLFDCNEFSSKITHKWKMTTAWYHFFFEVTWFPLEKSRLL